VEDELRQRPQPPPFGAAARMGSTPAVDAGQTGTRASVGNGGLTGPAGHGRGVRHLQSPAYITPALQGAREVLAACLDCPVVAEGRFAAATPIAAGGALRGGA
jgi:hypothetical protein